MTGPVRGGLWTALSEDAGSRKDTGIVCRNVSLHVPFLEDEREGSR